MPALARTLLTLGVTLLIAGVLVIALARLHLPLGRIPGDLSWRGRGWTVSFPLATSLLLSAIVSLVLWLAGRLR